VFYICYIFVLKTHDFKIQDNNSTHTHIYIYIYICLLEYKIHITK
jgi:hypothetical protein